MSHRMPVKPELLQWARERSRMGDDVLEKRFPNFSDWLRGERQPTLKQLEKFAAQTFTPVGFFFLAEPPEDHLPIPDFRTVSDTKVTRPSPHLLDTIHAAQLRQEWLRGFLVDRGEPPLPFIGARSLKDAPEDVAAEVRRTLGLEPHWNRAFDTWEETLRTLVRKIEGSGILVMINGVVENNTHRPLDAEEFRGFVLIDSHAPLIFINGADAKAAQMFTLVHELAHLWLGKGGISNLNALVSSDNEVETFCNRVAAEFLVPAGDMETAWRETKSKDRPFDHLARSFKVSPVVAARRVLDLGLISRARYFEFFEEYKSEARQRGAKKSGGGNFYRTLGTRLGKRFPAAVYAAAKAGRLPYGEAYKLTGVSGKSFDRFGKEFGFAL